MKRSRFSISSTSSVGRLRLRFKAQNCRFTPCLPLSQWRRFCLPAQRRSRSNLKTGLSPDIRELCGALRVEFGATEKRPMLALVISLLIIALIAAALGFGGIAGAAAGIAKIIFVVFIVLFLISLLFGGLRGGFRRGP